MNGSESNRAAVQPPAHYVLIEKIAESRSGVVYRARDTERNRVVALHVLAASGESDERFHAEAAAASALGHPNIATVFEIGRMDNAVFLAMEDLPGRTLTAILEAGKLPWRTAAEHAGRIADAMAAAHEAGILHRRLSPAGIVITPHGDVKVSDFGLPGGAVLSPEQAAGSRVDTRSDIYALGALLNTMTADAPEGLTKIIERCMRQNPQRRYQHMDEVKRALENVLKSQDKTGKPRGFAAAAVAAAALVIAIAAWTWAGGKPDVTPHQDNRIRLTNYSGLNVDPAISPDGRMLAYASDQASEGNLDIWIRRLAGGEAVQFTTDDADERQPSFSPDGTMVAFRSEREGGGIYIVPATGGAPRLLAKEGRDPRFSPDGTSVAYWQGDPHAAMGAIAFTVPAQGGAPQPIGNGFADARYPVWSPDGKEFALVGSYEGRGDWWAVPVAGGKPAALGVYQLLRMQGFEPDPTATGALAKPSEWQPDAFLFAGMSGDTASLWRLPYSPGLRQVTRSAEPLTARWGRDRQPAASRKGDVVFADDASNVDIWSAPLDANTGKVGGDLQRVVEGAARDDQPSVSQDGRLLVYRSDRNGKECIRVRDLASGKETEHCKSELDEDVSASISPAGARIAYRANNQAHTMKPDGSDDRSMCRPCRPWGWFPDEKRLLIQYGWNRVRVITDDDAEGREVLRGDEQVIAEAFPSPDGKWIAFQQMTRRPEGRQVFVAPFLDKDGARQKDWIPVTGASANDRNPRWSPDGNLLYFLSERDGFRCVWAQHLDPRTRRPRGAPFGVLHLHRARLSLMHGINPTDIGLSVAKGRLVLSAIERTGSIWLLKPET